MWFHWRKKILFITADDNSSSFPFEIAWKITLKRKFDADDIKVIFQDYTIEPKKQLFKTADDNFSPMTRNLALTTAPST